VVAPLPRVRPQLAVMPQRVVISLKIALRLDLKSVKADTSEMYPNALSMTANLITTLM
jgi:hypothetical protein